MNPIKLLVSWDFTRVALPETHDVQIVFTGFHDGEKLYEEDLYDTLFTV